MGVQQLPLVRNVFAIRARIRRGALPRRARRNPAIFARGFSVRQRRGDFLLFHRIVVCLPGFLLLPLRRLNTRIRRICLIGRAEVAGCHMTYQVILSLERTLTAVAGVVVGKCVRRSRDRCSSLVLMSRVRSLVVSHVVRRILRSFSFRILFRDQR